MTSDRTRFHFTPLAIAASLALRPIAQPPQADTDPEQGRAAIDRVAKALETREPEAGERHEKTGKVMISDPPRAGDVQDDQDLTASESNPPKKPGAARVGDGVSEASLENRRLAILVGSRIRAAREANGISQGDFARAIGHAQQTQPSLWEYGKRLVPLNELAGIAKALDTTTDYLLGLTDDMDSDPAQARRGLLVQHLRDQLEAVAGNLADVALESGSELEGAMRATRLLSRCEEVSAALDRFRAANQDQFDDLRGGAWLDRTTRELMEAAKAVESELDGVAHRRERAARAAREAMTPGTC